MSHFTRRRLSNFEFMTDLVLYLRARRVLQKYEVEFLLQQQWFDPRLRYSNASRYEFLNAIHHHEDVWLPDTYFIMHGDFKDPIIPMHFALRIHRNGTVNYLMR
jgi:Neurotransmitter-gated ion-channel ligand binding domain